MRGLSLSLCIDRASAREYGHRGYETVGLYGHRKSTFQNRPTTSGEEVDSTGWIFWSIANFRPYKLAQSVGQ
ncbi:hypothetical protein EMIT0P44_110106 [Pseudomonas sp. IT-P44]